MKNISELLNIHRIKDLQSNSKDEALAEMIKLVSDSPEVTSPQALLRAIKYRENIISTGVGLGIAIPHAKISSVTDFVVALGRSKEGIQYQSLDNKPVHLIFLIAASDTQGNEFLKILAKISSIFKNPANIKKVRDAKSPENILSLLKNIER
ncbi:PTS sugar transporter subunit IIA [Candidatus Latescibacterota bacterium]